MQFTSRPQRRFPRAAPGILGSLAAAAVLLSPAWSRADQPIAAPVCALRLSIEVTPDVPNPADPGFLSSLLGVNGGFQMFVLQVVDDTHVIAQLQGPGTAEHCRAVVDGMRNDGRVASIDTG